MRWVGVSHAYLSATNYCQNEVGSTPNPVVVIRWICTELHAATDRKGMYRGDPDVTPSPGRFCSSINEIDRGFLANH